MVVGYNGSANYDIWYVLYSNHTMSTSLISSLFLHKIHSCGFQISQLVFLLTFAKYFLTQVLGGQLPQLAVHLAWQSSSSLPVALRPSHNSLWLHNHVRLVVKSFYDCPYHNRILTWEISWRLFCHVFIRITQNCSIDPLPSGICQETHITVM